MKTCFVAVSLLFIFLQPVRAQSNAQKLDSSGHYAEGELLVKFKGGPDGYAAALGNALIGAEVRRNYREFDWQHVKLPRGMSVMEGMEAYRALGTVLAIEPNYVLRACATPDDPQFKSQWALKKIGATNAWAISTGSSNVVIAIIDSGVDYLHEDLAANLWHNPGEVGLDVNGQDKASNGVDDDGNGYVDDVFGMNAITGTGDPMDQGGDYLPGNPLYHGTALAGIVGAVGNNGKGISGVSWSCEIMSLVWTPFNTAQTELRGMCADVLECHEYVLRMKKNGVNIRVTNHSYQGVASWQAERDAIAAYGREGILCVYAAGNSGWNNDVYPNFAASFNLPNMLLVAATDSSDALAPWSEYGHSTVHLAAPGVGVLSTTKGAKYAGALDGTSFAAPHVVGAAALLAAVKPDITVDEIKTALLSSVDQPSSCKNKLITQGRLNIGRALQSLTNTSLPPIVIAAFPAGGHVPTNASIEVTFSQPMEQASVEAAIRIAPPVNGSFEWSEDGRTVKYHPDMSFSPFVTNACRILGTARDFRGLTLDGNYNRNSEGATNDDFTWVFSMAVPNDDLVNAQPISGASGRLTASNRFASPEMEEPDHAGLKTSSTSVWYQWIPDISGWISFDVSQGNTFDTVLAAYTGNRLDLLRETAGNDNWGKTGSRISFPAVAGTSYSIAVAGKSSVTNKSGADDTSWGNFTLSWYATPVPVFRVDTAVGAIESLWGSQVTLFGTNFTGVTNVLFDGVSAHFTNNTDFKITAWVPSGAGNGPITIQTPHGNVTSSTAFAAQPKVSYSISSNPPAFWVNWAGNGFVLEHTESLSQPSWKAISQSPIKVEDGNRTVFVFPFEGQGKFYRWKK